MTPTGVANGATANLSAPIGMLRQTFPAAGTYPIGVQCGGDTNLQSVLSNTIQVVVQ
jgi:hypothetical protein